MLQLLDYLEVFGEGSNDLVEGVTLLLEVEDHPVDLVD